MRQGKTAITYGYGITMSIVMQSFTAKPITPIVVLFFFFPPPKYWTVLCMAINSMSNKRYCSR